MASTDYRDENLHLFWQRGLCVLGGGGGAGQGAGRVNFH